MPKVQYGNRVIEYNFFEKIDLKSHYITVEKDIGVVLKGKKISDLEADRIIIKKARWIIDKLEIVKSNIQSDIVTGSRIHYLGRKYYAQILFDERIKKASVRFTESKFVITIPSKTVDIQHEILEALDHFFRMKAKEKITSRVKKWSLQTGMTYNQLKFQKLEKRWGSCTSSNNILINYDVIKLSFSLIDYLIVHELCHTIEKNHSKMFYNMVSKYLPNWKRLDEKISLNYGF
ncbi:MAG TPA: SprT family zinc-dependent metalloprotease [Prolixibacteraceae bacterium]|jgi:hypothetical protein